MLTKATMHKAAAHEAAYGVSGTRYFPGPSPMRRRLSEHGKPVAEGAWVRRWNEKKGMYEYVQKE